MSSARLAVSYVRAFHPWVRSSPDGLAAKRAWGRCGSPVAERTTATAAFRLVTAPA